MIYHIIDKDVWEKVEGAGEYRPASVDTEGFIHCSTSNQINFVANEYYAGARNLALLHIEETRVLAEIIWEDLSGLNEKFPHIYGALNLDAVVAVTDFDANENGEFEAHSIL